jgi:hypothetical protein
VVTSPAAMLRNGFIAASELRQLSSGRFEATCGKCRAWSAPLAAVDAETAWADLLALGWSTNVGGWHYPVRPKCTANPQTVDDKARAAMRDRKRK